ncbi:WD40 repeat domain-containing protein [Aerosakkonemataceae cyanobacterium BLCC-F50]|uniref:WD40 repeat domain-containing protein n=1 Tax=Floridaenema flaviceps BLCC-F50 TaxID=3153642 RepID=A0ABV4XMZ9_9CYAN
MELELGLQLLVQGLPAIAQIFTALQEERLAVIKHEQAKEFNQFKSQQEGENSPENRNLQKWRREQEIAAYHRETVLQLVDAGREIAQKYPEHQKFIDNWPLKLLPSQFLTNPPNNAPKPLRIFLAPIKIQGNDIELEKIANWEINLAQSLREFICQNYPLTSPQTPVEFIAKAWKNQEFEQETSIKALFEVLKFEPTLIFELEIIGKHLNLRIAYWGIAEPTYSYQTIISHFPYLEMVYTETKKRALQWRETASKLLAAGVSLAEIQELGGDNVKNLEILEKESKWQQIGIVTKDLNLQYQYNEEDLQSLFQWLISYHCFLAGCLADLHHLINYKTPPKFPELLPKITQDFSQESPEKLLKFCISFYNNLFSKWEDEDPDRVLESTVNLAKSLTVLADKYWATEQINYAIKFWLKQKQIPTHESNVSLETVRSLITVEDRNFLENIKACLLAIGDESCLKQVCRLLTVLENLSSKTSGIEKSQTSLIKIPNNLSAITKIRDDLKVDNISIIHTLNGHSGKASSVAVSHDGSTLASGGDDNTIKLWHLGTGELLQTLNGNSGRVLAINVSPDGQILASSHRTSDRSCIKIWQLQTGELIRTLTGHNKWIYSLAISPDGKTLISGSHKIKTWQLETGEPLHSITGHKKCVYSLAISPDGEKFASSGGDKTVKVWHLQSGELIHNLEGHFDWVRSVVISPDGEMLASGSDDNTIKLWNLQTGKLLRTLIGHSDWVLSLAFSPDGQTLISGSKDNTIRLWHLETGKLLGNLTGHKKWVYSLAVSPDGQTFASGSEDKTVKIWRAL